MLRKIILALVFLVLIYGFWFSPQFKEIAAGVAIFLLGMMNLQDGFKAFTGGLLEKILQKTTDKLWKSVTFGVLSTAIMQSSTLVSLITISFLSASLISLSAGIGIIFGANLGTTTGAWLIAAFGLKVNIAAYAMPMMVFGTILLFQKNQNLKGIGYALVGMGFVFLGIHYMKEGFDAFKSDFNLTEYALGGYRGVLLFTLIGIVATVVMQSSHATLVLIITALAASQVTYENALALAIGANLGTAVTSTIGALGANIDGKRLVAAHLIFNLITAAVAIVFIFPLTTIVDYLAHLLWIAPHNYTLKLAIFHTIFNGIGIALMLPFIRQLEWILGQLFREKNRSAAQACYLHKASFELSDTVLEAVRKETIHLYDNAFDLISGSLQLNADEVRTNMPIERVLQYEAGEAVDINEQYIHSIKGLYSAIVEFISTALPEMTPQQTEALFAYRAAGQDIVEAVKESKHLHKNLYLHGHSANATLRSEYQQLRRELAEFLRELDNIKHRGDDMSAILLLDGLRLKMKTHDQTLNRRLEETIRAKKITPTQATSLMNDSHYAYEVVKSLVKMGGVLFRAKNRELHTAEQLLRLEDDELIALAEAQNSEDKE